MLWHAVPNAWANHIILIHGDHVEADNKLILHAAASVSHVEQQALVPASKLMGVHSGYASLLRIVQRQREEPQRHPTPSFL